MNEKLQVLIEGKPFQIGSIDDFLNQQEAMHKQCESMDSLNRTFAQHYLLELGNCSEKTYRNKIFELNELGINVIAYTPNDDYLVNPVMQSTPDRENITNNYT
ncbi:MAG: hypothetical protein VXZ40_02715 [Nanoarchaeota archaeon]|nr:hypothetical protein [Nanoarchaeota archaeon]